MTVQKKSGKEVLYLFSHPSVDLLELIILSPSLSCVVSPCSPLSFFSLLWPSQRISPKLWVQGCCPTPWLLLQQWPLQLPRTSWLSVQQLLHPIHTITIIYCKARLSVTPSWDLLLGPSAPPTGQFSSPLTDTSPSDFGQSGAATPKAHCEDTNMINKLRLIGEKIQPFIYVTERKGKERRKRRVVEIYVSLFFPLPETLPPFQRLLSDLQMEWAEERYSLCIELPCTSLTSPGPSPLHCGPVMVASIITEETHADLSRNIKPHVVLHNYSGPGWFSPVTMAQCVLLILCTSKTKTIM